MTSLGSAIFAFLAAGAFKTIADAQRALCPPFKTFDPRPEQTRVYDRLYAHFKKLYFSFGQRDSAPAALGDVLPDLRAIAAQARQESARH